MRNIGCLVNLTTKQEHRLRSAIHPDRLIFLNADLENVKTIADFNQCEIIFGNPPKSWFSTNTKLRWIQLESVGFGEYLSTDWEHSNKQLQLTNLAGFFSDPVSESILAGILALLRGIDQVSLFRDKYEWVGDDLRPTLRLLKKAKVVMFGRGAINQRLEKLLEPFQCKVIAFGKSSDQAAIDSELNSADIIVSTVPDTPQTRNFFNRSRIMRLKAGAIFVNFGRGSVVDDEALADALESGSLFGAVIDVTRDEPLPQGHRFWNVSRLILTQHSGGGTANEIDHKIDWFLENLDRYRNGATLHALIDFSRGY